MFKLLLSFILGAALATFGCIYFYSDIIRSQKAVISDKFLSSQTLIKAKFAAETEQLLRTNIGALNRYISLGGSDKELDLTKLLLANSLVITAMSFPSQADKEKLAMATIYYYKKNNSREMFIAQHMQHFIDECQRSSLLPICEQAFILELFDAVSVE